VFGSNPRFGSSEGSEQKPCPASPDAQLETVRIRPGPASPDARSEVSYFEVCLRSPFLLPWVPCLLEVQRSCVRMEVILRYLHTILGRRLRMSVARALFSFWCAQSRDLRRSPGEKLVLFGATWVTFPVWFFIRFLLRSKIVSFPIWVPNQVPNEGFLEAFS
jgi:hypothetical protein